MAARVSADDVKEIMDTINITGIDDKIDAMIIAADLVITKVFENDVTTPATLVKEIERWLVAHMLSATIIRSTTEEAIGDVRIKFAGIFGKGLQSTPYGQMVLTLDVTGKMANSGKMAAGVYAVPTIKSTE